MADQNVRVEFEEIGCCFHAQGCRSGEQKSHGAQVVLGAYVLSAQHVNNDWRHLSGCGQHLTGSSHQQIYAYQEESGDLIVLNGVQVGFQFELGENDCLVASVCTSVTNDHKSIDMALRKETKSNLSIGGLCTTAIPIVLLKCLDLKGIGNHIAVRDLHSFLVCSALLAKVLFNLRSD